MGKLSCIIPFGPKYNQKCSCKRETERALTTEDEKVM